MKSTASPTVLRFLTSSSGILTSNFSSALTTIVIIEMESMSRSSVKDLSSSTVSAAIPVSSLTSSARPARTSSVDSAMVFLLEYRLTVQQSMGVAARGTRAVERDLGQDDDLGGENEARAEADLQGKTSAELRVFLEKAMCSK